MIVDNPEQFLHDSGLLFHFNRNILHPLGLSMSLVVEEVTGEDPFLSVVLHETEDTNGYLFPEPEINECHKTLQSFLAQRKHRLLTRASALGYIVQPLED